MSFQKYRLPNTSFCKCPKSHVLAHSRTVNMLKGPKHCWDLHDSSFVSFVHYSAKIALGKSLS